MSVDRFERARRFANDHALLLIIALAALLRFATVGTQSFWLDEQVTVSLIQLGPLELLRTIPLTESNPDLYYLMQAGWERVWGSSEAGIRSFSAVVGTATIPFVYGAGKRLASRRAGLIAATLAATSPMLIWYSQEARNYALFVFIAAVAFYLFVRALNERDNRWLWGWALASSLTLCTHFFAFFLIVPQLGWLAFRRPGRRIDVAGAGAAIVVTAIALLPIFATVRGRGSWIADYDLGGRLLQVPEHFLIGLAVPWRFIPLTTLAVVGAICAFAAIRAGRAAWRAAVIPVTMFSAGFAILLIAAIAGEDYILSRNLIGLWVPFAIAVAVILATTPVRRLGTATAAGLGCLGAALAIWVPATPAAQRPDYAELARALGPADVPRLIVSQTTFSSPLALYLPNTRFATDEELSASEIVVVDPRPLDRYAVGTCWWIHTCGGVDLSPPPRFEVPAGFKLSDSGSTAIFDYEVFVAPAATAIERPTEYFTPRVFAQDPV